jgi:hypothetical protein
MRTLSLLAILALALATTACEEEQKKACPAQGLGVVSELSGKSCEGILDPTDPDVLNCQEQMQKYTEYDCTEVQVCPDHGAHQIPRFVFSPKTAPESLAFTLTNCSVGNTDLNVEKVEVYGDPSCHFKFDATKDVQYATDNPGAKTGETIFVQARYDPAKLGQDHAQLRVYTNAVNFPVLRLPICARAVAEFQPGVDSGPLGIDGGDVGTGDEILWRCKDVGETIAPCHQQQQQPDSGTGDQGAADGGQ